MPVPIQTSGARAWGPDESQALRELLATPFGRRLAFALVSQGPSREGPPERVLGRIEGHEHVLGVINQLADAQFALISAAQGGAPEMYPDLDDNTKWTAPLGGTQPPQQIP